MDQLTTFTNVRRIKEGTKSTKEFRAEFANGHTTAWFRTQTEANLAGYQYLAENGTTAQARQDAAREVYVRSYVQTPGEYKDWQELEAEFNAQAAAAETVEEAPVAAAETAAPAVGDTVETTGQFQNLPMGTLLVATSGTHLGTSYRIHVGTGGEYMLTSTTPTGTTREEPLEHLTRGDYSMGGELTIVWMKPTN